MLIDITRSLERLLNQAQVMYGLSFILTTLLLYSIYVLSSVIAEIPYYALYW